MTDSPLVDPLIGLCARCRHSRIIASRRGSKFWLCELSKNDPRFLKYPPLPVVRCAGYEARPEEPRGFQDRPT